MQKNTDTTADDPHKSRAHDIQNEPEATTRTQKRMTRRKPNRKSQSQSELKMHDRVQKLLTSARRCSAPETHKPE